MPKLLLSVHGDAKVGKSWLADSAPGPRLVLDIEGGVDFTKSKKILWDPRQSPPKDLDESCSVIARITHFDQIGLIYQWLQTGDHPFRSVIFDSLSELQKRCRDSVAGVNAPDQQEWGVILGKMEGLVRGFRDMMMEVAQPMEIIVFVSGSHDHGGKRRPMLQGQFGDTFPYYMTVVGYLYLDHQPDGSLCRRLLINPIGPYEAGDRTHLLTQHYGKNIDEPNITEMMEVVNGNV